ncbi:hypothetical protein BJ170DRAFT_680704 [Xylariales sp. AK1849]|nr:hypothetical protein BJ170DRAFT_680704 [Xylariales sp. AK1849]
MAGMVNHMAQGAATSIEDGAFLGCVLAEVVKVKLTVADALDVYEAGHMPEARMKQQVSFVNGAVWMLSDTDADARDEAMKGEFEGLGILIRSPNLYNDPTTAREFY